jgi:riboflavin kinase/FMN adenylyltransferase
VRELRDIDELPAGTRFVLAIGSFDGVHRGHRRVIDGLVGAARALDAQAVALTFDPHPAVVLHGARPSLLCDLRERVSRLASLGVDVVVVQHFDTRFASQSPRQFIERITSGRSLAGLVMTDESAFGRDRQGGLEQIRALAPEFGFKVIEVSRLASAGSAVSSSRVRELLAGGRLSEVNRLLGRPYAVIGTVVPGDRRGRELGYPTANMAFDPPVALPNDGIYAVRVSWDGEDPLSPRERRDGVASLGVRPNFKNAGERLLEAFLFDFDGDLYGKKLRIEFVRRLRGEKKFGSIDALVRQMDRDADRARDVLAAAASR